MQTVWTLRAGLTLTPSGDVLVTETRQNRIRLLRDTNGDGVADVKKTFATFTKWVNIPFGMTFAGNSFFLGNTGEVLRFPYTQRSTATHWQRSKNR
jgi:glucose/arabinose dehydrogenase